MVIRADYVPIYRDAPEAELLSLALSALEDELDRGRGKDIFETPEEYASAIDTASRLIGDLGLRNPSASPTTGSGFHYLAPGT